MKLIETKTLGTAAASIEFTSIPQTPYTDLLFLVSTRSSTTGATVEPCLITFNSNIIGYTARTARGAGSQVKTSATLTTRLVFNAPRAGTSANTFGNASLYIQNYRGAANKTYSVDSVTEDNQADAEATFIAGVWANTAAITGVLFTPTTNNFVAGSTISLYGITRGISGGVVVS
jgi:hypothetical protein